MRYALTLILAGMLAATAGAKDIAQFAVNEYFGMTYDREPVSLDVTLAEAVPASRIGLKPGPCQVEVLEGTEAEATKARVWTLATFGPPPGKGSADPATSRHMLFTVHTDGGEAGQSPVAVQPGERIAGVATAVLSNGLVWAKVPVGSVRYDEPASALEVPGPVVSISRDGKEWIGSGYLDSMRHVESVTCTIRRGSVYAESRIDYAFEGGRHYRVAARLYAAKPYVQLVEDFDLGGASRFVFNYDDWFADAFFRTGDNKLCGWESIAADNPCGDFVRIEGQEALARLVVWTQFNYFGGKQETIALKAPDGGQYKEIVHTLAGATIRATQAPTPGGDDATAVGAFYVRPDRWTRPKVNHVDLYLRPEVPGDRMTRGVVGLAGAKLRAAMEAWLVEGHREWAIFAVSAGDRTWLAKAHVQEGVWPLDRLRRLTLTWNSDGTPVAPADTAPAPGKTAGGMPASVLMGTKGRSGLQNYNGSNGAIRWCPPLAGFDGQVAPAKAAPATVCDLASEAAHWYMAADDSAYPAVRAMLPWTDPEALNPFYQGMENMNFSADLYRYMAGRAVRLMKMGHPDGRRMLAESQKRFDMALDRYVYLQSGCWEESHGYAGHTIGITGPLAVILSNSGLKDFREDIRFARMMEFFLYVHSPIDAEWGNRVVPAVGDHGQNRAGPAERFKGILGVFAGSKDPQIRKIVAQTAWLIREDDGAVPDGITPEKPDLRSRWLQGYGSVLRAVAPAGEKPPAESFLVLRAGQSWGHHHEDKGSMWFWGRNVHFFGDCSWGAPPGGTYWNKYKQGPASGTQIELVGVTNWTLPCKYAAPFISDEQYADGYDYANARCLYPFNPALDLSASTPASLRSGYDRQVLFVHPDLLIVRDNVETVCPTIWRMHSFQPDGTTADGPRATLASAQGPAGELAIVYPPRDVKLRLIDRDILNDKYRDSDGLPLPQDKLPRFNGSVELRWDMPPDTSATWVFAVRGRDEQAPRCELLDDAGRVCRVTLGDGTTVTSLMNIEAFRYVGEGIEFEGTVGLVVRKGAKSAGHAIRGKLRAQ